MRKKGGPADEIIREVCNDYRSSDLRADNPIIRNRLNGALEALAKERDEYRELAQTLAMALILNEKEWIASLEEIRKMSNEGHEWLNPYLAMSAKKALKSLSREVGPDPHAILKSMAAKPTEGA